MGRHNLPIIFFKIILVIPDFYNHINIYWISSSQESLYKFLDIRNRHDKTSC